MAKKLLFLSLACLITSAMIRVNVVGIGGPICICDMPPGKNINDLKKEVLSKTGFAATVVLNGTESLGFDTTIGDVAQGESSVTLTAIDTARRMTEVFNPKQNVSYTITIKSRDEADADFPEMTEISISGPYDIKYYNIFINTAKEQEVIRLLEKLIEDYDPDAGYAPIIPDGDSKQNGRSICKRTTNDRGLPNHITVQEDFFIQYLTVCSHRFCNYIGEQVIKVLFLSSE